MLKLNVIDAFRVPPLGGFTLTVCRLKAGLGTLHRITAILKLGIAISKAGTVIFEAGIVIFEAGTVVS